MRYLSVILRSMHRLVTIGLARNRITDDGVDVLLHEDCYSSTMKRLDLSCNNLGIMMLMMMIIMGDDDDDNNNNMWC